MRRWLLFALPLAALVVALLALDEPGWQGVLRAHADSLRTAAAIAPLLLAVLAATFRQGRLVLACALTATIAGLVVSGPVTGWSIGIAWCLAVALPLVGLLRERGVLTPRGAIRLALAGSCLLLIAHANGSVDVPLLPDRLGTLPRALRAAPARLAHEPAVAVAIAAGIALTLLLALGRRRADARVMAPALSLATLACLLAVSLAAPRPGVAAMPLVALPAPTPHALPVALCLLAATLVLALALHRLAWRHGRVDDLTGLPGRRSLDERLDALGRRHAIAVVDVDRFKRFNDRHGHAAGDAVLRVVAKELARVAGGTAYRQGGEEFALVFPRASLDGAVAATDAVREAIAARSVTHDGRALRVTVSAGVAARTSRNRHPHAVLEAADQALLRAKRGGRNRVEAERRRVSDRRRKKASS